MDWGCSYCRKCTKCVAAGNDTLWDTYTRARVAPKAHRPPCLSDLPAPPFPADHDPLRFPWCDDKFPKAFKTVQHAKICSRMPLSLFVARTRSLQPGEADLPEKCSHCGTGFEAPRSRANHERHCVERFRRAGRPINSGQRFSTTTADARLPEGYSLPQHLAPPPQ
eukprot:3698856-Pyramimonas_sp.AAC.1